MPDSLPVPSKPPGTTGQKALALGSRYGLRTVALGYLAVILAAPLALVFWNAFEDGFGAFWDAITAPAATHALYLTVIITLIAVPLNAIFGVGAALILVRRRVPAKPLISAFIDLPLALSPVVVGLALVLVWGNSGWFGPAADDLGVQVIFALPGMVLATIFICLPFVVREVVPVLREIGTEQEQAGSTLGATDFHIFRRITLPAIRWGITYGVVLTTARSLGEYGAVSVVSGKIEGKTETLTLYVDRSYRDFSLVGSYTASVVLALLAVGTLLLMTLFRPKKEAS
jgi:sulfate transport system permease protein